MIKKWWYKHRLINNIKQLKPFVGKPGENLLYLSILNRLDEKQYSEYIPLYGKKVKVETYTKNVSDLAKDLVYINTQIVDKGYLDKLKSNNLGSRNLDDYLTDGYNHSIAIENAIIEIKSRGIEFIKNLESIQGNKEYYTRKTLMVRKDLFAFIYAIGILTKNL